MERECRRSVRQIENYRRKISGPLLDRIEIHVEVPLVDFKELSSQPVTGESSATVRERVAHARGIQVARFRADKLTTNAGKEKITGNEILEAIQFRSLDRRLFE